VKVGIIAPRAAVQRRYERVVVREILRVILHTRPTEIVLPGVIFQGRIQPKVLRGKRALPEVVSLVETRLEDEYDWEKLHVDRVLPGFLPERPLRYAELFKMCAWCLVFYPSRLDDMPRTAKYFCVR
jgi:hypothetical protein